MEIPVTSAIGSQGLPVECLEYAEYFKYSFLETTEFCSEKEQLFNAKLVNWMRFMLCK